VSGIVIEEFCPMFKNSWRGFARVRLASGMVVHDITLHVAEGRAWASPSSCQMVSRTGPLMVEDNGKTRWQPLVSFVSKPVRDKSSDQVVAAVREAYPDALRDTAERAA